MKKELIDLIEQKKELDEKIRELEEQSCALINSLQQETSSAINNKEIDVIVITSNSYIYTEYEIGLGSLYAPKNISDSGILLNSEIDKSAFLEKFDIKNISRCGYVAKSSGESIKLYSDGRMEIV